MQSSTRTPQSCSHRCAPSGGQAICGLVRDIVGIDAHPGFNVSDDACRACCESFPPSTIDLNPVIASLLYAVTEQIADGGGVTGCDRERASELNVWAVRSLPVVSPDEDDCDDIGRRSYEHLSDVTAEQIRQHLPIPIHDSSKRAAKITAWSVGVTTSARRIPTVETCVMSILRSGWEDPVLFVDGDVDLPESIAGLETCRRTSALGAFPNYMVSLAELYMRDPDADAYMMVQDDARLLGTPALRDYLQEALWFEQGPCMASIYCSKKYNQQTPGWHRFDEPWVWGAVAFIFSRDAVRAFLTSMQPYDHRAQPDGKGLSRIDVIIGQFAVANQVPIYFPCPSLVQHIGTISTIWDVARAVNSRRSDRFLGDLIEPPEDPC